MNEVIKSHPANKGCPHCGRQQSHDPYPCAVAVIESLKKQLPGDMEHCTIRFIRCERGHGRLIAMNWRDKGCLHCEIKSLQAEVAELRMESDMVKESIKDEIACLPKHSGTYIEIGRLQALEWALARFPEEAAARAAKATNDGSMA